MKHLLALLVLTLGASAVRAQPASGTIQQQMTAWAGLASRLDGLAADVREDRALIDETQEALLVLFHDLRVAYTATRMWELSDCRSPFAADGTVHPARTHLREAYTTIVDSADWVAARIYRHRAQTPPRTHRTGSALDDAVAELGRLKDRYGAYAAELTVRPAEAAVPVEATH